MYQFLMCVYCVYHYVKNSQNNKVNKSPSQMAGWVSLQLKGFMKARQIHTALQTDPVCRLSFSLNVKRWFHWMVLLSLKQWAAKRRWILFDHQHCNTSPLLFSFRRVHYILHVSTCINFWRVYIAYVSMSTKVPWWVSLEPTGFTKAEKFISPYNWVSQTPLQPWCKVRKYKVFELTWHRRSVEIQDSGEWWGHRFGRWCMYEHSIHNAE
jgi:hypothetical protein